MIKSHNVVSAVLCTMPLMLFAVPSVAVELKPKLIESAISDNHEAIRASGHEGRVIMRVSVDRGGTVQSAAVAKHSASAALDEAALKAVEGWKFQPGRNARGEPVESDVFISLRYEMEPPAFPSRWTGSPRTNRVSIHNVKLSFSIVEQEQVAVAE